MPTKTYADAIDDAIAQAMQADERVVIWGEDLDMIRRNLYVRFGAERVRCTPISEGAFVGAGVTAAMGGLRPIVELLLVDFAGVAMDAILNHAAKIEAFSGGQWPVPLVIRAGCGGGYGDGGQHQQALWGWLAHIPGLTVVVPSTPADAGGLMLAAIEHDGPVIFLEHKLLSTVWREGLGRLGRSTVTFDVPPDGEKGPVPRTWMPLPFGQAAVRREGRDLTIVSVSLGVHRALAAAGELAADGVQAGVIDLRTVTPLDVSTVRDAVKRSGRLLVVDEDYQGFGLSGELAAVVLEGGIACRYARVCTQTTIPFARHLEEQTLPNVPRIVAAARDLLRA
ncbi:MAG: pyruvate dehydrogenase [Chloroflexi bacterium]|nr:pyruvate dehydrogenase [Chloroflexota bacterium]